MIVDINEIHRHGYLINDFNPINLIYSLDFSEVKFLSL